MGSLIHVPALARRVAPVVLAVVVGTAGQAGARVEGPLVRAMRINLDGQGVLELEGATNALLGRPVVGAQVEYLSRPLVVRGGKGEGEIRRELVYERLQIGLGGAIRVWRDLTVIGFVPMAAFQNGTNPPLYGEGRGALRTSAIGDFMASLKYVVREQSSGRIGYAFVLPITFPTATPGAYMGRESTAVEPTAVASMRAGSWRLLANVGAALHRSRRTYDLVQGSSALLALGASYDSDAGADRGLSRYWFDAELRYTAPIHGDGSFGDLVQHTLELHTALRIPMGRGLFLNVGAGFGLLPGVGVPAFRPFAHLQYRGGPTAKQHPKPLFDPLGVPRSGT